METKFKRLNFFANQVKFTLPMSLSQKDKALSCEISRFDKRQNPHLNASLHAANETSTDKIIIFKKAIVAPFVEFASILKKSGNFLETKFKRLNFFANQVKFTLPMSLSQKDKALSCGISRFDKSRTHLSHKI